MPRRLAVCSLVLLALAPLAAAQSRAESAAQLTRETIENQRRVLVAGSLPLTEREAAAFWPLFDEYQKELAPLRERSAHVATEYIDAGGQLSEEKAHAMVSQLLAADEQTLALRRKYMKRMERALSPRKLAQFFQLDRKLDAVVAYEYAQRMPLLR